MAKKKQEDTQVIDINENDGPMITLDQEAIKHVTNQVISKTEEMKEKLYSVKMNATLLKRLNDFVENRAEWTNKEALGIIKLVDTLKETKVENGYIYLKALPLQAAHYFLSKEKGIGLEAAKAHMELYDALDNGLARSTEDVKALKKLENELAGLQQGIKTE